MNNAVEYHDQTVAKNWNKQYEQPTFRLRLDAVETMLETLPVGDSYWLDAGCGTGVMSLLIASKGGKVLAVDASENMLEIAKESSQEFSDQISYSPIESVESLPYEDNQFDGIVCSSVLEYLQKPKQCLAEFHRVIKPQGHLIISVPNSRSIVRQMHGLRFHISKWFGRAKSEFYGLSVNSYTRKSLRKLAEECSFEPEEVTQLGSYLPLFGLSKSDFVSSLIFAKLVVLK